MLKLKLSRLESIRTDKASIYYYVVLLIIITPLVCICKQAPCLLHVSICHTGTHTHTLGRAAQILQPIHMHMAGPPRY